MSRLRQIQSSAQAFSLTLVLMASGLSGCGAPAPSDLSIYGGQPVPEGERADVLALTEADSAEAPGRMICTATLIAPRLVLTAAHCVEAYGAAEGAPPLSRLGLYRGDGVEGGRVDPQYQIEQVSIHPLFRKSPMGGADLALLTLTAPIHDLAPRPIVISGKAIHIGLEQAAQLVGFGERDDRGIGQKYFVDTRATPVSRWQATAGGDGRDSCYGDSGGPLLQQIGGQWQLLGVISRGRGISCGRGGYVSLLPAARCWLAAAGAPVGQPAGCSESTPHYSEQELAAMEFGKLCLSAQHRADQNQNQSGQQSQAASSCGQSGLNVLQRQTIAAVMSALHATSCAEAAAELANRSTLDLSHRGIKDLSPLAQLTGLRKLNLVGNQIDSLAPLRLLPDLQRIDVSGNQITSWDRLPNNWRILGQRLQQGNFANTDFITACQRYDQLAPGAQKTVDAIRWVTQVDDCALANQRLLGLHRLRLNDRELSDLGPLRGLQHIKELDLSGNPLTRLDDLAAWDQLRRLNITATQIESTAPLARLISEGLKVTGP